jgi:multimeric flavodoxin WrbA
VKIVTAFVGSARKGGFTHAATRQLLDDLESSGDVRGEIVFLSDFSLGVCRGCKACFVRGEEHCPLEDDRDLLIEKMTASDGVVLASPVYSFQVSAVMKIFLDRLGFAIHRPRFHGKAFTCVVVQGIYGGRKVREYLEFVGGSLGFDVVRGSCITALEPMVDEERRKMDEALGRQARRLHEQLARPAGAAPSMFRLWAFRMARTTIQRTLGDGNRDHAYYRDHGWFDSEYYYPTRLGPLKKAAGAAFDWMAARASRRRECS